MTYRRCGRSGLMLPAVSLGMWHNFGGKADHANCVAMMRTAFDLGVTHFDLANNYGPPPGSAEERVGKILRDDFAGHRDELIISTKAGFRMWPGPYGDWGGKKYLTASLDQSLSRLGLDYVDIFYHHRPDPNTPLEETLAALDLIVRQGKALYAGVSSYLGSYFTSAVETVRQHDWSPITINQPLYNMFARAVERDLLPYAEQAGVGVIPFCPLAQGLLTDKYLGGIPENSRAKDPESFLREEAVTQGKVERVRHLSKIAEARGQTMAEFAISWTLRDKRVTSALIGASRPEQIRNCVAALDKIDFTEEELGHIDRICPA
jgi:L-glyceraldehyde 3-phosphate reductase